MIDFERHFHLFPFSPMEPTELVKEHPTCTYTLPETNSSHLKMDSLKITFLLGPGNFSGAIYVKLRGVYLVYLLARKQPPAGNPGPQPPEIARKDNSWET